MNFVLSAAAYLFISGLLAGLAIHSTAQDCGTVSRQVRDYVILHSLIWPMLIGVIVTTSKDDIEKPECSETRTNRLVD